MKIAFTTTGTTLDDPIDPRFGRAPRFLIVDTDSEAFTLLDNAQNLNAAQGAGIQAAQHVSSSGAQAVVSGHCGPKAFHVLTTAGIDIYTTKASSIREALTLFKDNKLSKQDTADVEGHWV